jgi:hypothetical protein
MSYGDGGDAADSELLLSKAFLMAMSLIAGNSLSASAKITQTRLPSVMRTSWLVFPAVQTVAFRYLPPPLWLPLFNLVAFTFGLYINIKAKLAAKKRKSVGGGQGSSSVTGKKL